MTVNLTISMTFSGKLRLSIVFKTLFAVACTLMITSQILSQKPVKSQPSVDPAPAIQSVGSNNSDTTGYSGPKRNTFKMIFSGEPGKAALYSLLIPSGGQVYNKKWWKVPLAIGIDGYFLYNLVNKYDDYNRYNDVVKIYQAGGSHPTLSESSALNLRANARTNREYAWVYLVVGHLVTVFDAYVDRHLMDFDISQDLSHTGKLKATLSFTIPLNKQKKKGWVLP